MYGSRLQVKRFEDRIEKYEAVPVETGKILFYGDSTFTRCSFITKAGKDNPLLEESIRMKDGSKAVLNHGFGTSKADDLLYYYSRMVRPYKPRALVISTGSNDVVVGYSAKEIMEILARIIDWAQADFPDIPIYCFSIDPTLKNKGVENTVTRVADEYNEILENYCLNKQNCTYIPLHKQAFYYENPEDIGDRHKVREDIYHEDKTHFNPYGYTLFFDFLREFMDKEGLLG